MQEQIPQIEVYCNVGSDEQNAAIEQMLTSLAIDKLVQNTLHRAGIMQPVMLTLLISDDATIQEMNNQYRQQNKATDVLSFPLLDKPLVNAPAEQLWMAAEDGAGSQAAQEGSEPVFVTPPEQLTNLGDIVISWPTIIKQAAEVGHSPTYELLYLISHGVLHLVGYDDQSEAGYHAMVEIQQSALEAMR